MFDIQKNLLEAARVRFVREVIKLASERDLQIVKAEEVYSEQYQVAQRKYFNEIDEIGKDVP